MRSLYLRLKRRLRPKAWLTAEEDALIPPRRLWIGPDDPISHYYRWVWEYLAYLTLLVDLRREEVVLELGCGHGRTARGLLSYLRAPGRYTGLDVDRRRLREAQRRISSKCPSFQFVWANVRNRDSNPAGCIEAVDYVLPFDDGSFDVVYAASLFTHLPPAETLNYFRQTSRVLRPDGRCLFSVFLLDHYRGPGTTVSPLYEFDVPVAGWPGVAVRDASGADLLFAYSREMLGRLCREGGLKIARVVPGLWSERPGWAVHEQDLLVLTKG